MSRDKRLWDQEAILAELVQKEFAPDVVEAARRICDWARGHSDRLYFSTSPDLSKMGPNLGQGADEFHPFLVLTDGTVRIYFQYMLKRAVVGDESFRRELLRRLNEIDGVALPEDSLTRRPGIPLKILARGDNTARFLHVMDWFVGEWRRRSAESPTEPASAAGDKQPLT